MHGAVGSAHDTVDKKRKWMLLLSTVPASPLIVLVIYVALGLPSNILSSIGARIGAMRLVK